MTDQHLSRPKPHWLSRFLPTPGNIIFTLLAITLAFWAQNVGALPGASTTASPQQASSNTISYQGRLANSDGEPLTGQYNMEFRIYDVPTGGTHLWQEYWTGGNSVQVSNGLFNVMLGSIDNTLADAIASHDELYLGITVGTDSEISPRALLGSVPYSFQAQEALTVSDDSITSAKIADDAVGSSEIASDAVGSSEIADDAVGSSEIVDGSVTRAKVDFAVAQLYHPALSWGGCHDLIADLQAQGFSQCVYASSPGPGYKIRHSTTDCSDTGSQEPNLWQKYNIWTVSTRAGYPTYIQPTYHDTMPYLICTRDQ